MLLAIKMPEWLTYVMSVYGDVVTPLLITLLTALVTAIALKIRTDAKVNAAKADLQIQALKEVANREDNKPELEKQSQEIDELKRVVTLQSEMIHLAFQNSNLTPEVKDNLASLSNKIKYGTEDNLVKELETEKAQLQEQIESLKAQLETKVVATVQAETKKRTRR
jgi:hypothetical protein